jgi:hypothetical protein
MQNKNFALAGGAAFVPVTTQNGCEALDLVGTAAFDVTYADFDGSQQIGDASPAVPFGASSFKFTVYAPRGYAFKPGQTVAFLHSVGAQNVSASPVRFGN